jgi:hypothetical protein
MAGAIAISWQRAAEQAAEFGHTLAEEVKILMLHGVLHLLGMDHEKKDRGAMARTEEALAEALRLPASLTSGCAHDDCPSIVTLVLALVLVLVTPVQMLYMEAVRVRPRELPFLELFRGGLDERLGSNPTQAF